MNIEENEGKKVEIQQGEESKSKKKGSYKNQKRTRNSIIPTRLSFDGVLLTFLLTFNWFFSPFAVRQRNTRQKWKTYTIAWMLYVGNWKEVGFKMNFGGEKEKNSRTRISNGLNNVKRSNEEY